ncbi:MAG: TonB-dependent siderophore receptor, partial [Cyanobacteria bacterium P01_H01_bin.119]
MVKQQVSSLNFSLLWWGAIAGQLMLVNAALGQTLPEVEGLETSSLIVEEQPRRAIAPESLEPAIAADHSALADTNETREEDAVDESGNRADPPHSHALPLLLSDTAQPTTTVTDWVAQLEASVVQVTNVRLETTETGLQVVLETVNGDLAMPTTAVSGNALILEIPNAILTRGAFEQFEPAEGIALVQVSTLPGDIVQVAITGTEAAPEVDIATAATELTLTVVPGIAQAGDDDDAIRIGVIGEEGSRYFEPNTSTATRTDTPLRDIPQSIQVIPREVLEDQQVITLGDALRNASSVVRSERIFNGEVFTIRGFSGATILRDGFRLTDGARVGFLGLSNLESVEVLKGPAAILAGSVEPGGAINLVSAQPLSEPFYELGLRLGNRTLIEPSVDLTGPLTEDGRLLYRLNALHRTENDFRGYSTDIERFFIAPTIRWQISDRSDLTLFLEYSDNERPGDDGIVAIGDGVANIPRDRVIGELDDIIRQEELRLAYQFEHRFSDFWTFRNRFSYFRNNASSTITSAVAPVNETTGDFILIPVADGSTEENYDVQTNVIGEFNTGSVGHTVLFGVDLLRARLRNRELRLGRFTPIPFNIFNPVYGAFPRPATADLPIAALQDTLVDGLGIYVQDQIDILDNLILLAGIRYDTIQQTTISNPTFFNPNRSESTVNADAFTPRVGLVYQPIEEVSLYGSYSTSFSPNTATTFTGEVIPPEEGQQFEVGIRTELLNGRLIANLAFFDLTKQNVATPDPNPLNRGSVATGEQSSRGIELDIAGEILPGWNIITNYAYTDATITSDNRGNEGNR